MKMSTITLIDLLFCSCCTVHHILGNMGCGSTLNLEVLVYFWEAMGPKFHLVNQYFLPGNLAQEVKDALQPLMVYISRTLMIYIYI